MKITVLAVGTKMPKWVGQGVDEYQKRLPRNWQFTIKELALGNRGKSSSTAKVKEEEGKQLLAQLNSDDHVVALDLSGKHWSTEQLAGQLNDWQQLGKNLVLLIGGPDGLSQACLQRANQRFCLSALTLPHPLVRVLLTEQLYRAWSVNTNHPYHK